jgi:hypothetical protein
MRRGREDRVSMEEGKTGIIVRRNIWTFEHKRHFLEEENGKKMNFVRSKLVGCSGR